MSSLFYKETPLSTICVSGSGTTAPNFPTSPPTSLTNYSNSRPLNVDFLYQNTDISQYYTASYELFTTAGATYNRKIGNDYPSNVKSIRVVAVSGGGGAGGDGGNVNYAGTNSGGSAGGAGGWSYVSYVTYPVTNGDNISISIGTGGSNGNKGNNLIANITPCKAGTGNGGSDGNITTIYLNNTAIATPPPGNGGNGGEGGRINKTAPPNRDGKSPGNSGSVDGVYGLYSNAWDNVYFYGAYGKPTQNGFAQIILLYD